MLVVGVEEEIHSRRRPRRYMYLIPGHTLQSPKLRTQRLLFFGPKEPSLLAYSAIMASISVQLPIQFYPIHFKSV